MTAAVDTSSPLDVLVIGAGFAGICVGKFLRDAGLTHFRIVDKAERAGGTWHWNRYPGAACDVISHFYCFSFEPKPDWSRKYAPWHEIQAYAQYCLEKYGLSAHTDFGREMRRARFDDASGLWEVAFTNGDSLRARHVVDGSGGLHVPLIPRLEGENRFAGPSWHSSAWRDDVDLAGKRVAVIGSAASAVQIVPEIAQTAGRVVLFQRTANWIIPRKDRAYSAWEKQLFRRLPLVLRVYREFLYRRYDWLVYPIVKTGHDNMQRRWAERQARKLLRRYVHDPDLRRRLTPDFPIGCKRILISDNFYAALARDNVDLVTAGIESLNERGVRCIDEREHPVDVIVYATGFDTQGHHLEDRITGPGGRSLREAWSTAPMAYEGCMVAGFPNFHLVTGPNTGVGSTSVIFMIEQSARFIVECIRAAGANGLIAPRDGAMKTYDRALQKALSGTVWATGCHSWYKREDGRITALYPFSARTFRKRHKHINLKHFKVTSRENI